MKVKDKLYSTSVLLLLLFVFVFLITGGGSDGHQMKMETRVSTLFHGSTS